MVDPNCGNVAGDAFGLRASLARTNEPRLGLVSMTRSRSSSRYTRHRVGIDRKREGERLHGRQLLSGLKAGQGDRALDLFDQLQVDGDAAARVDREDGGQERLDPNAPARKDPTRPGRSGSQG